MEQRNIDFYKECFKKLEIEDKTSFSYIAGISPVMWLVFRKMYGWAFLFALVLPAIETILKTLIPSSILIFVFQFAVFGFFGNTLYYKHVKSKVEEGYAEIEGYNSIDPIWSVLSVSIAPILFIIFVPVLVLSGRSNYLNIFQILLSLTIIAVPWAIEYKKFRSQIAVEVIPVTEESIGKYLEKADSKKMFEAMWILVLMAVAFVISTSGLKAVGKRVLSQLDRMKVEEESITKNRTEKLDNISKELRKTSKESYVENFEEARQDSGV